MAQDAHNASAEGKKNRAARNTARNRAIAAGKVRRHKGRPGNTIDGDVSATKQKQGKKGHRKGDKTTVERSSTNRARKYAKKR